MASNEIFPPSLSHLPKVTTHGLPIVPPETNEITVLETFGHDLSSLPEQLNNFLLAVSFDKVTKGSVSFELPVGVPFITYTGNKYWIDQLLANEDDLSTLLNSALILLLSSNEMLPPDESVNIDDTINSLLLKLEEKRYWPASYLLAEHAVLASKTRHISMPEQISTINRLFTCGEIGFAPCQIRLGLQLFQNEQMKDKAILLLRNGLSIYDTENRYQNFDVEMTNLARRVLNHQGNIPHNQDTK